MHSSRSKNGKALINYCLIVALNRKTFVDSGHVLSCATKSGAQSVNRLQLTIIYGNRVIEVIILNYSQAQSKRKRFTPMNGHSRFWCRFIHYETALLPNIINNWKILKPTLWIEYMLEQDSSMRNGKLLTSNCVCLCTQSVFLLMSFEVNWISNRTTDNSALWHTMCFLLLKIAVSCYSFRV